MKSKALLVGINNFPGFPLKGCLNDLDDMEAFLKQHCGFGDGDIHRLENSAATSKAITSALKDLVSGLAVGDRALFHFSGHGTTVTIGDEAHDTIVPHDFDYKKPDTYMTDDTFRSLFSPIPEGCHFVWVVDSCHSGNLARGLFGLAGRADVTFRTIPIPAEVRALIAQAQKKSGPTQKIRDAADKLNLSLLTACTSEQEAQDTTFKGRDNGVFTHFLLGTLQANVRASEDDAMKKTSTDIKTGGFTNQSPELRGADTAKSKALFAGLGLT